MRRGSNIFMVIAILMIVFGAIAAISSASYYIRVLIITIMAIGYEKNTTVLIVCIVISVITNVMMMVAGIIGVINRNRLEKAKTCIIWGIICIVLVLIDNLDVLIMTGAQTNGWVLLWRLVLSVVYYIGAKKNADKLQRVMERTVRE